VQTFDPRVSLTLPKIRLCVHVWMEYYDFKVFERVLRQNLHHEHMYSGVVMGLGQKFWPRLGQIFVAEVGSAIFGLDMELENFP